VKGGKPDAPTKASAGEGGCAYFSEDPGPFFVKGMTSDIAIPILFRASQFGKIAFKIP
jgi:hypothetical protein